ncbi:MULTISPECIES: TM2 domain-containing protein [unclassified Campylobacter]|uniref:TM2 domain-containing protein n=1 Tax=unclassified Campylobacter TaxID=2593542 RepID=UPI001EE42079|nr:MULTISPECIES: TM2 domain-containing protein [unclassified Campylobacter]
MKNAELILLNMKDKIPNDAIFAFKESLEKADDDKYQALLLLNLKNPIIGLLLSLCMGIFGIDRFYKGNIGLGIAKLAVIFGAYLGIFSLGIFTKGGSYYVNPGVADTVLVVVSIFVMLAFIVALIWYVVDIFCVFFGIKKDNLRKIYAVLG